MLQENIQINNRLKNYLLINIFQCYLLINIVKYYLLINIINIFACKYYSITAKQKSYKSHLRKDDLL